MTVPRVLYVQYTNPAGYPPVEHGARLLADAGWDVLLLGIAISDAALALGHHDRIRVKLRPPAGVGWRQKLHYAKFLAWAVAEAGRWRPDWIYASDALSCPIALVMATACGGCAASGSAALSARAPRSISAIRAPAAAW